MLLSFCRVLVLLTVALAAASRGGEPFSFAKTPGRLPKTVIPYAYRLRLEPSLQGESLAGSEFVEIEIKEPIRELVLNAAQLEIKDAALRGADGFARPLLVEQPAAAELLKLKADDELRPGRYVLELSWSAKLREQPQGLFITRYATKAGEKRALVTQMEPVDARRMFPCWDEPVFRSTFELTVIVPQTHMALSNMPIAAEKPLPDGRKEVRFSPTPAMASYLVALAVGEFEAIEDEFSGTKLRIITTEGKAEQGRYALEATKKILAYYNDYFGQPYPLPKLDQFCFPGYPMGGMENWGTIFYNDTALLVDSVHASQANRERVFGVVAHEIAHQWFGDLVTMAWWDDLWLNEGFASWMGTKATDHFNPEWTVWERAAGAKEWAMALDARRTTHPIQQPVASEAQANDAFDEITYQKGQSFLRMLEGYLGPEPFRQGIRAYMAQHAYSSTTTADLWAALDQVTGKGVKEIAANWTEQPGFPLITARSRCRDGKLAVTLTQERFAIHQKKPAALLWKTPVTLGSVNGTDQQVALLSKGPLTLALPTCDSIPKLNAQGAGYYRVAYDEATYIKLADALPTLPEADRLNFFADTWALVQAERLPPKRIFDLLMQLSRSERSFAVWEQMLYVLGSLDELLQGELTRKSFREWASILVHPQVIRLGWEAKAEESALDKTLRGKVLKSLGEWGDASVNGEAMRRFQRFAQEPDSLDADLRNTILILAGHLADAKIYDQLHDLARRETAAELKSKLYHAMAASHDSALAQRTLDLALTEELTPNEATNLIGRVAGDGEQREQAWTFAQAHREQITAKLASFRLNDYFPSIARGFAEAAKADELVAFAKSYLPPGSVPAVEKATDDIRFKAELKARLVPALQSWLGQ